MTTTTEVTEREQQLRDIRNLFLKLADRCFLLEMAQTAYYSGGNEGNIEKTLPIAVGCFLEDAKKIIQQASKVGAIDSPWEV